MNKIEFVSNGQTYLDKKHIDEIIQYFDNINNHKLGLVIDKIIFDNTKPTKYNYNFIYALCSREKVIRILIDRDERTVFIGKDLYNHDPQSSRSK